MLRFLILLFLFNCNQTEDNSPVELQQSFATVDKETKKSPTKYPNNTILFKEPQPQEEVIANNPSEEPEADKSPDKNNPEPAPAPVTGTDPEPPQNEPPAPDQTPPSPEIPIPVECGINFEELENPLGGGYGYTEIINKNNATIVNNYQELDNAVKNASSGDVIYINDQAIINLSSKFANAQGFPVVIDKPITLASGRGSLVNGKISKGALLLSEVTYSGAMIRVAANDVRITGLRLQGPSPDINFAVDGGTVEREPAGTRGIVTERWKGNRVEIDNNELYGFGDSAISFINSLDNHVHHNYIHNNQRLYLGYGVTNSYTSSFLAEYNIFNKNRHAIAASGEHNQDYTASNNLILSTANDHVFDVHGIEMRRKNKESFGDKWPWAGGSTKIINNLAVTLGKPIVDIRGVPFSEAVITGNYLVHSNKNSAFKNTLLAEEAYMKHDPSQIEEYGQGYEFENNVKPYNTTIKDNCYNWWGWFVSKNAISPWIPIKSWNEQNIYSAADSIVVDDFTNDGYSDALISVDNILYLSKQARVKPGITVFQDWEAMGDAPSLEQLLFGDFNGDGYKDFLQLNPLKIALNNQGESVGTWTNLLLNLVPDVNKIKIMDFNNDQFDDIFYADGDKWTVFENKNGEFQPAAIIRSSPISASEVHFDYFYNNDELSAFHASGTEWKVLKDFSAEWLKIQDSAIPLKQIKIGKFDSGNHIDLITKEDDIWVLRSFIPDNDSLSVKTNWGEQTTDLEKVKVGKFGPKDSLLKISPVEYSDGKFTVNSTYYYTSP